MKFLVARTSCLRGEKPCEGAIARDDEWVTEIASLEELQAFIEKHGNIVISKYSCDDLLEIEIYDTYRE